MKRWFSRPSFISVAISWLIAFELDTHQLTCIQRAFWCLRQLCSSFKFRRSVMLFERVLVNVCHCVLFRWTFNLRERKENSSFSSLVTAYYSLYLKFNIHPLHLVACFSVFVHEPRFTKRLPCFLWHKICANNMKNSVSYPQNTQQGK